MSVVVDVVVKEETGEDVIRDDLDKPAAMTTGCYRDLATNKQSVNVSPFHPPPLHARLFRKIEV